VAYWWY